MIDDLIYMAFPSQDIGYIAQYNDLYLNDK